MLLEEEEAIALQLSVVQTLESTVRFMLNLIDKTTFLNEYMEELKKHIKHFFHYILVYVDSSDICNNLSFQLGGTASGVTDIATRKWSIKV